MSYVENYDWAMCGLQTFPVILFSLLCISLLRTERIELACACGVLACFSSANGFLLCPLGVLIYRKKLKRLTTWIISFCVAAAVYLYKYVPVAQLDAGLYHRIVFFVCFIGGAAENQHRWPVRYGAFVLGLVLLSVFAASWRRKLFTSHPSAFYSAAWIILTGCMVTKGRAYMPVQVSLTMRYRIYSDLLLAFSYVFLMEELRRVGAALRTKQLFYLATLCFSVLFCTVSDFGGYKYLVNRRERIDFGIALYMADHSKSPYVNLAWGNNAAVPGNYVADARTLLEAALQKSIYDIPRSSFSSQVTKDK